MQDDNFIPGFARKNKSAIQKIAEEAAAAATVTFSKKEPEPSDEKLVDGSEYTRAQPAKKKTGAVRTDLQAQRYQKAKADLDKWMKRARFANNKVAALQLKVKRYEKQGLS